MSSSGLCLQDLVLSLRGQTLIELNVNVAPGEVLSVMGPSGSGKSTLLAAIIGALPTGFHLQGRILLAGQDITGLPTNRRRIGILFQRKTLPTRKLRRLRLSRTPFLHKRPALARWPNLSARSGPARTDKRRRLTPKAQPTRLRANRTLHVFGVDNSIET